MKENVKKKITDHIGLKLLALLLAIIVWLVVMNIEDYSVTKTFKNIPVEQLNGETLNELDKVYDVVDGETVDIVVKGRRTLVDSLTEDDFYAVADLSKVSVTNSVTINVSVRNKDYEEQLTINCNDNQLVLRIEDKVSKQLPVLIVVQGEPLDGHALGKCKATPNIVTIEGAKSVVESITELRAVVDVTDKQESFEVEVSPKCYNIYGESMDGKNVTVDTEKVTVSIPVYNTKEVPVKVTTVGRPTIGYKVTNVNYHPQTITVAGEDDVLAEYKELTINDIALTGKTDSFEVNISTEDYLPESILLADTNSQIAISVTIEKLVERSFNVTESDITFLNMDDAYDYEIVVPTGKCFTIQGLQENIETFKLSDFELKVDCESFTLGENLGTLQIKESGLYEIKYKALIRVVKKEKEVVVETSTTETTTNTTTNTTTETITEGN